MRKRIALTVDGIVCRGKGAAREILLIRRGREPFKGKWALPGGFVEYWETVESAAVREVFEETGLKAKIAGLVGVYSDPKRDPRGRTVSIVYALEIYCPNTPSMKIHGGDDAADAKFFPVSAMPELAFDHAKIIADFLLSENTKNEKPNR